MGTYLFLTLYLVARMLLLDQPPTTLEILGPSRMTPRVDAMQMLKITSGS
jgi:hypothetical protein